MANTGKTVATLLIGAAIGAAGYILATDKDTRQENMERIKDRLTNLKGKFNKRNVDLEEEIYNA